MNAELLFSAGVVLLLSSYYGYFWFIHRRPALDSHAIREDLPHQFSPVLLRLFWTGKLEWSSLLLIGFHAVQEKIYTLQQNSTSKHVRFRLVAPQRFDKLDHEEKAAFSMGKGVPLPDIIFAKKRRPIHADMMSRLESYTRKTYKGYLLPYERIVRVGLLLQWLLYLCTYFIAPATFFKEVHVAWAAHAFGLGLLSILGGTLIIDRLRWEDRALPWTGIRIFAAAVGFAYFLPIGEYSGVYSMYAFTLLIHGFGYHYLPRLTKKAWPYSMEVAAYRNHLLALQSKNELPITRIPHACALDIDHSIAELNQELLSEENITEDEWLEYVAEPSTSDASYPWWLGGDG